MDETDNTPPGAARAPGGDEPGAFLDRLLARADNLTLRARLAARDEGAGRHRGPDAALLVRLGTALMHRTELHAMRQRKGPPRPMGHRTLKHIFLLADGSHVVLWEVEHNTAPDARTRYQLYADQAVAEEYVRERFGEPPLLDLWPRLASGFCEGIGDPGGEEPREHSGASPGSPAGFDAGPGAGFHAGSAAAFDPDALRDSDVGRLIAELFRAAMRAGPDHVSGARPGGHHDYEADNSADHGWRLLRRAENPDRPGEPVRELLRTAVGHRTTLVTLRHDTAGGLSMEWSLYEHAFLLADGAEISLWELEHSITPEGRPVCEVYLDESTARDSVERHRAGS